MLPKEKRLNLKKDFKKVSSGKKLETKYLRIFWVMGSDELSKVGMAISSSTFKRAHDRNRAKRLTSAAFEAIHSRLPKGINIVALPKSSILDVKSQDVLLDLEEKLKDEKIIN